MTSSERPLSKISVDDRIPEAGAWARLRTFTPARIGLARAGVSIAAGPLLDFRAAHAAARDAVMAPLNVRALVSQLASLRFSVMTAVSCAGDRREYLMRPDLGRELSPGSAQTLAANKGEYDLSIVAADGLSSIAVQRHVTPLLERLLPALSETWRVAPIVIAELARVGLGDAICSALGAASVLVLIGERPGLSATDSLSAYVTWASQRGVTDADRNCVSNIRPEGVAYDEAARQVAYLLNAARAGRYSGVALKNRADEVLLAQARAVNHPSAQFPVRF
jgi:ethanolamine ammonia-lyase small subunit